MGFDFEWTVVEENELFPFLNALRNAKKIDGNILKSTKNINKNYY